MAGGRAWMWALAALGEGGGGAADAPHVVGIVGGGLTRQGDEDGLERGVMSHKCVLNCRDEDSMSAGERARWPVGIVV